MRTCAHAAVCALIFVFQLTQIARVLSLRVNRPRGVSLSNKSFYENKEWFTCLDGSAKIPFKYINDDYCDCRDGTDEPGTSACPNGKFHCVNPGHSPKYIPSSRVNDGICDCCDASDEYDSGAGCSNTCRELGRAERERKKKEIEMQNQGFQIRQQYIEQGKQQKEERKKKIEELEQQEEVALAEKKNKEALRDEVEKPEVEAKDREDKEWEEEKAKKQEERDREKSKIAFEQLDEDDNHEVSIREIQLHIELDKNEDGIVDENEAKEILAGFDAVDLKVFIESVWPSIKATYKAQISIDIDKEGKDADTKPMESKGHKEAISNEFGDTVLDDDDDDYGDDYDDPNYEEGDENFEGDSAKVDDDFEPQMEYSQETKELIQKADSAREEFKEASEKLKGFEREIGDLNKLLSVDLGNEDEFTAIQEQCFEYQDREYTYQMCPFKKVSQKPKSGRDTTLGNWGNWEGNENDKYSVMKYTGGEKCWNGPERSATVKVLCGVENKVISASEPNRCEYALEFTTPAACTKFVAAADIRDDDDEGTHDEL